MPETKKCSKCGEVKGLDAYPKNKTRKNGLDERCKQCAAKAARIYRASNIEIVREKDRVRAAAMPSGDKRAKHKKWADENRDHVRKTGRATMKKLYSKTPEKFKAKSKEFHTANRDQCVAKMKTEREKIASSYVATALRMRVGDLTPELIALKREQIAIHRLSRQLKQATKENT